MATIKNLLLDLGDVLLDLNFPEVNRRFRALLGDGFEQVYRESEGILQQLETGLISEEAFLAGFRERSGSNPGDEEILSAWNVILKGVPARRLQLLDELYQRYDLYLLSNTNAIHMRWFDRYLLETHGLSLHDFATRYFRRFYLSFELRLRKPDPAIFRHVLRDAGILASETLFVDDLAENIHSAAALGLQVYHHNSRQDIAEVLPKVLKEMC